MDDNERLEIMKKFKKQLGRKHMAIKAVSLCPYTTTTKTATALKCRNLCGRIWPELIESKFYVQCPCSLFGPQEAIRKLNTYLKASENAKNKS